MLIHTPVLIDEIISNLQVKNDGTYLDCTFGAGGYSKALLNHGLCHVSAIDRDHAVVQYASILKAQFHERFDFHTGAFGDLSTVVKFLAYQKFDGIIFDVGVSSMQIDQSDRGFSFQKDGPLDMRMDQTQQLDAAYIVNHYSVEALHHIIKTFGDERKAKYIAQNIIIAREKEKITSTKQLSSIITNTVGQYHDTIHPATRTFQALRIVVNDELTQLKNGLAAAITCLHKGGYLAVVTFHSGEDFIVKEFFKSITAHSTKQNKYAQFSKQTINPTQSYDFSLLHKKPIVASTLELQKNIRARSAKLRILKRNSDEKI